jgi:hypothetical protein
MAVVSARLLPLRRLFYYAERYRAKASKAGSPARGFCVTGCPCGGGALFGRLFYYAERYRAKASASGGGAPRE